MENALTMKKFSIPILAALLTLDCVGVLFLSPKLAYALTPPTFIQEAETDWSIVDTPSVTASFDVQAGDVLVAYAIAENYSSVDSCSDEATTVSGGSLTWNNEQTVQVNGTTWVGIWTATVDTNKSMTVSFADGDGVGACTQSFGGNVFTFRGSGGVGASNKTTVDSGAPTLNITTEAANSAVVVANGDWNALDGASRT
jgi:hypothetical protein